MKFVRKPTKFFIFTSSIFMMLMLACLTVSLPFANEARQKLQLHSSADTAASTDDNDEDGDNSFANTTEEKTSNSLSSLTEEYLHDAHAAEQYRVVLSTEYKIEHASIYIAFYGELISPPPDLA